MPLRCCISVGVERITPYRVARRVRYDKNERIEEQPEKKTEEQATARPTRRKETEKIEFPFKKNL